MSSESYVQPIVLLVDKADPAPNVDGIRAAALASVLRFATNPTPGGAWDEWLAGSFTKSVRRADARTFDKISAAAAGTDNPGCEVQIGQARAIAFAPSPYTEMPKFLTRLQVSGTTLPEATSGSPAPAPGTPAIVLNGGLRMSTGKAAAQAGHALFAWYLDLPAGQAGRWATQPDVSLAFEEPGDFFDLAAKAAPSSLIVDSGLTEIDPGSPTAFVMSSRVAASA